jgi:phospholipid/cholesterol/gamma-HCH transport system substrate-binding protein
MHSSKVEISVGLFILVGFLAFAFLAIQVSGLKFNSQGQGYQVTAHFSNVAGLTERAKVMAAGVKIGRVVTIRLNPDNNKAQVTMEIQPNVDFLTEDSIAAIQTAGILGEKYISISNGGSEMLLENGSEIVDTQSALVLEELIGKFLTNMAQKKEEPAQ